MWADWFGKEFTSSETDEASWSDFPPRGLHRPALGAVCLSDQLMCCVALTSYILWERYTVSVLLH